MLEETYVRKLSVKNLVPKVFQKLFEISIVYLD